MCCYVRLYQRYYTFVKCLNTLAYSLYNYCFRLKTIDAKAENNKSVYYQQSRAGKSRWRMSEGRLPLVHFVSAFLATPQLIEMYSSLG